MSEKKTLSAADLDHFTGDDHLFLDPVWRVRYTEGVRHIAEHGAAYWLIDAIAGAQREIAAVRAEEFQVWTLTVLVARQTGVLACDDGNGNIVYSKALEYTDFPLSKLKLYFENNTLCLPAER
jgi:hypothetical protein